VLLLLLLSYFGIWLARLKVRCIELFIHLGNFQERVYRYRYVGEGCTVLYVCIESRCTVHVYLLASLIFYFLLMFCAQRFTKGEIWGAILWVRATNQRWAARPDITE